MTPLAIHLDGLVIDTEAKFHAALRDASGVEWYGANNLDALFDLLVGVITGPVDLVWTDAARSRAAIGPRFDRIVTVLLDAVAERDGIRLRLES